MKRPFLSALLLLVVAMPVAAQYKDPDETPKDAVVKRDETVKPQGRYANMPDEAVPYGRFTKPYYDWFVREDTLQYNGAADLRPDGNPARTERSRHRIFLPRWRIIPRSVFGVPALHGAQLAIEQANARGGYHGKPYALKIHNRIGPVGSLFRRTRQNAIR